MAACSLRVGCCGRRLPRSSLARTSGLRNARAGSGLPIPSRSGRRLPRPPLDRYALPPPFILFFRTKNPRPLYPMPMAMAMAWEFPCRSDIDFHLRNWFRAFPFGLFVAVSRVCSRGKLRAVGKGFVSMAEGMETLDAPYGGRTQTPDDIVS